DGKTEKGRGAMGQLGRTTKVSELPSKQALKSLVQKAMVLNETAVKVNREPKYDKKPVTMPKELSAALARNKKAKLAFDAMSPSHRKEYMEWIGEAKRGGTRGTQLPKTHAQAT